MNWIEAIFHYAPDHGNGMAEALFLLASIVAIVVAIVRSLRRNVAH
jgi:hypothetical protein